MCACERVLRWMCVDESVFVSPRIVRAAEPDVISQKTSVSSVLKRGQDMQSSVLGRVMVSACVCVHVCVREMNFYCFINLLLGTGLRTMSVCIVSLPPSHAYSNDCR